MTTQAARDYERGYQRRQRNALLLRAAVVVLFVLTWTLLPMMASLPR